MAFAHNELMFELGHQLRLQLDRREFRVRVNMARVRKSTDNYYVPDVFVLPIALVERYLQNPDALEVYDAPLPLVVEVWSPSTGGYDVNAKLPEYQRRGDLEIWRLQPYEHTLTAWRRNLDGSYVETVHAGGVVYPIALPGVSINLDELFG